MVTYMVRFFNLEINNGSDEITVLTEITTSLWKNIGLNKKNMYKSKMGRDQVSRGANVPVANGVWNLSYLR